MTIYAKLKTMSRGEKTPIRTIADTDGAGISIENNTWKTFDMGGGDIKNPNPYAAVLVRTRGGGSYIIAQYETEAEATALVDAIARKIAEGRRYITIDAGKITEAI